MDVELSQGSIAIQQPQSNQSENQQQILQLLSQFDKFQVPISNERKNFKSTQNLSSQYFIPINQNFIDRQYAETYKNRLEIIKQKIDKNLEGQKVVPNIMSLKISQNFWAIGTLFQDMKLQPSVLGQMNAPMIKPQTGAFRNYCTQEDKLFLEDNTGRINLELSETEGFYSGLKRETQPVSIRDLFSGLVIGVYGTLNELNKFTVTQIMFSGLGAQEPIQNFDHFQSNYFNNVNYFPLLNYIKPNTDVQEAKFVALVSGLNFCDNQKLELNLDFLKKLILGNLSHKGPLRYLASTIGKLVLAGNCIGEPEQTEQMMNGAFKNNEDQRLYIQNVQNSIQQLDLYLSDISQNVIVNIMPGNLDPTSHLLPQQPLNKLYFSNSFEALLTGVTNPFEFKAEQTHFLGTSGQLFFICLKNELFFLNSQGQNIQDIMMYSQFSDQEIDILELSCLVSHIAPTAPDTLQQLKKNYIKYYKPFQTSIHTGNLMMIIIIRIYPFDNGDRFYLENLPHVYFVGNCEKFATQLIRDNESQQVCRLICVPDFKQTLSMVIVNIDTLDTFQIVCDES